MGSASPEFDCNRGADPSRRAGDQRDAAGKLGPHFQTYWAAGWRSESCFSSLACQSVNGIAYSPVKQASQ